MANGVFQHETCLLKHHVRVNGWLSACAARRKALRSGRSSKQQRGLRYFTFCAIGAIDVLMLDVAKLLDKSDRGFDTVFFFDRTPELVAETQNRIPGAIGFAGDFVKTVLGMQLADLADDDALEAPDDQEDTYQTRELQRRRDEGQKLVGAFPFDVVNLDLEEFVFKPRDEYPGKVVTALRKFFEWQRMPLDIGKGKSEHLSGFTLMFTTQIGPPNMREDHLALLEKTLGQNLVAQPDLVGLLQAHTGQRDANAARLANFDAFFKLGMPKLIASMLMAEDWCVDSDSGIQVFEFNRDSQDGPYTILHIVMQVKRHEPPRENRGPQEASQDAENHYAGSVRGLFQRGSEIVTADSIDRDKLRAHLATVFERRQQYYPEDVAPMIE